MALTPGTRIGSHEIGAQIGAGGMGEVYRATDTNLKRQVAIKVLPGAVATDSDRLARFQREAEVLASLNHPNIAGIHGLERVDGQIALVMELVEGPTLADRIAHGPIPLDEVLPIAKQIAEAIEAAHEIGIIHRDLKPANIKVRPDGTVKVLDFGLARALEPEGTHGAGVSLTNSPTITSPAMLTGIGVLLGTAAYMSPEQAKGRAADKRSDVWAFGAVLYEMLSGRRAFEGEDLSDTLAHVLMKEPDWTALPAATPAAVATVLRRCLEKDRKQRVRDIGDVFLALQGAFAIAAPPTTAPAPADRSSLSRALPWTLAATSLGLTVTAAVLWFSPGRIPTPEPARLSVMVPSSRPLLIRGFPTRALAVSSDGTQLVYVSGNVEEQRRQLQLRSLATLAVRDVPGTEGAAQPFFSPDGRWVGFFTGSGELKKVSLAGGDPVTLLRKISGSQWSFGVWTDDSIIFGTPSTGLRRVSVESGEATELTTLDPKGEQSHSHPTLVPSGRAVLYWVRLTSGAHRIDAVTLGTGERRPVVENGYAPAVLDSGHLLFQRGETILIAPFDPERLSLTGPAVPLVDAVRRDSLRSGNPLAELAIARSGTLAYVPDADTAASLVLVGRDGASQPLDPPRGNFRFARVSPDGGSVAFLQVRGQESEVLAYDLARGSTTVLTRDDFDSGLAWHPDGRSLAIASRKKEASGIFLKHLDGRERLLVATPPGGTSLLNMAWSPGGTELAYTLQTGGAHDIWVLTMGETPTIRPFLTSAASEHSPAFSPNGRWLAYTSDESGRSEVFVQAYPQGERLSVSTSGGSGPVWRRDGKELYFESEAGGAPRMMAVSATLEGASLRLGKPVALFNLRVTGPAGTIEEFAFSGNAGATYDVLPDGRFVMFRGPGPSDAREIVVVQHWFEELKRLVPAK